MIPIVEWFHWRHKKFTLHWHSVTPSHISREKTARKMHLCFFLVFLHQVVPEPVGKQDILHQQRVFVMRSLFVFFGDGRCRPIHTKLEQSHWSPLTQRQKFLQHIHIWPCFKALQKSPHPYLQISSRHRHWHGICSRFDGATNCNKYMNLMTPYMLLFCVSCRLVGGMDGRFFELDVEGFLDLLLRANLFLCKCFFFFTI